MPDTVIDLQVHDECEVNWPTTKLNHVHERQAPRASSFSFACEVGPLRVVVGVTVGVRDYLYERLIVIDPLRMPVIDRVLLNEYGTGINFERDGYVVPMAKIRRIIRDDGLDVRRVCRAEMEMLLARMLAHPDEWERRLRSFTRQTERQLEGMSGGLPSLGKR